MAGLETRWRAILTQLQKLEVDTRQARGEARARLTKLDRQTRRFVERTLRDAEPRLRQAMREAARIGRGVRAGVQASAAAYRTSGRKRAK